MTAVRGLVDTSVLIAREVGRPIDEELLPATLAISVVTLAELHAGVLLAADSATCSRRLVTLDGLADMQLYPVDSSVAVTWSRLRVHLAESRRRLNVNDVWIAATAVAHQLPLVTQDSDFDPLDGVADLRIVRV